MIGPTLFPVAFAVGGAIAAGWAGAAVGLAIGLLTVVAVIVGAATWARQIGALLEADDAWENAPRPPGFARLTNWVYERSLPDR